MKWIDEEYIISYGFYKKYGSKINKEDKEQMKVIEKFRQLQKRPVENAFNTFKMKLVNYAGFDQKNKDQDGGLHNNDFFKEFIKSDWEVKYEELLKNFSLNKKSIDDFLDISIKDKELKKFATIEYKQLTLNDYINEVKLGHFKIPLFQRDFVWTTKEIVSFLNALLIGHPFGTITSWESTSDALNSKNRFIEAFSGDPISENVGWIIDGQQRTTSIIATFTYISGFNITDNIIFSFETNKFKVRDKNDKNYIWARHFLDRNFSVDSLTNEYGISYESASIIEKFRKEFYKSKLGIIKICKSTLDTAIDIFTDMNTKGKRLSLYDILHAKWLSEGIKIDIDEKLDQWYKNPHRSYKPDKTVLIKSIYLAYAQLTSASDMIKEKIDEDFINEFDKLLFALNEAHDFLVHDMGFKGEIMPSTNFIKILTYYYYKSNNSNISGRDRKLLRNYIAWSSIKNRYSSSTNSRLLEDIVFIDKIINNDKDIDEKIIDISEDDILDIEYGSGTSGYLFIINSLFANSRSLTNNSEIPPVSTNKKKSEINIHHLIPKAAIINGKKVIDIKYANSIANLAPINAQENKKIGKTLPGEYYYKFEEKNKEIDESLKNIFVNPNQFKEINKSSDITLIESFLTKRAKEIAEYISSRFNES